MDTPNVVTDRAVGAGPGDPEERSYRVVGPLEVCGTKPGGRFTALLPADQEAALIEAGHIRRLPDRKPPDESHSKPKGTKT